MALRIAVEQLEALRCKLRIFGVPTDGPADVCCDNQSVVDSSSLPQRALQKKHNAARFHKVREAAAMLVIRVAKIDGTENLADIFTKIAPCDSYEEEAFGIALLLSDWQSGKVGRRRLISWSRLVPVNSEKPGVTPLGVRFVDSL